MSGARVLASPGLVLLDITKQLVYTECEVNTMNETQKTAAGIEADLDTLIFTGAVERTVKPFPTKDWEFTMHTLSSSEREDYASEIPNSIASNIAAAQELIKVLTLSRAITRINYGGREHLFSTAEQKAELKTILHRMSALMLDMVYLRYLEMADDLLKILDTGVKKN